MFKRNNAAFSVYMMTSSNGNILRVTGPLCGEFTGHRWILRTKARKQKFDVFFDLHMKKRLSKQSWGWWFETQLRSLWCHCNAWTACNCQNHYHLKENIKKKLSEKIITKYGLIKKDKLRFSYSSGLIVLWEQVLSRITNCWKEAAGPIKA